MWKLFGIGMIGLALGGCGVAVNTAPFKLKSDNVQREVAHHRSTNQDGIQQSALVGYKCPAGKDCEPEWVKTAEGYGLITEIVRGPVTTAPLGMFSGLFYRPSRFSNTTSVSNESENSSFGLGASASSASASAFQSQGQGMSQFQSQGQGQSSSNSNSNSNLLGSNVNRQTNPRNINRNFSIMGP